MGSSLAPTSIWICGGYPNLDAAGPIAFDSANAGALSMIDESISSRHTNIEASGKAHSPEQAFDLSNASHSDVLLRNRPLSAFDYALLRSEFERLVDLPPDIRNLEIRKLGLPLDLRHRLVAMLVFDELMLVEPEQREHLLNSRLMPDALRNRIKSMVEHAYVRIYLNTPRSPA